MTGCNRKHVICPSCLRAGLRAMVGDTFVVENLLCGCFGSKTRRATMSLAERADVDLQELMHKQIDDAYARQDFQSELEQTRHQFDLVGATADVEVPPDLYRTKAREWFKKVHMGEVAHLYYPCQNPSCADKVENWMLISDFEEQYQARGKTIWECPARHRNSVLPPDTELKEMNCSLLAHPEYYVESAAYSNCPMRRYRLCKQCLDGGMLMLAVHGGECKQWPGYGRGHHHCFCFVCTRAWGTGCDHGSRDCADPGLQQVRRTGDALEIGLINSTEYIRWLEGHIAIPPPTVFASGVVQGNDRQQELEMTDRATLLAESRRGTT